jgi:hypothetical protein
VALLGGDLPPGCSHLTITAGLAWANITLLLGLTLVIMAAAQTMARWQVDLR